MKTAVIYARYSCDDQTEQSIEGQLRVCEKYAAKNDILILDTYIDRAMTGTNDMRSDFQRMIRDSAKKAMDLSLLNAVHLKRVIAVITTNATEEKICATVADKKHSAKKRLKNSY